MILTFVLCKIFEKLLKKALLFFLQRHVSFHRVSMDSFLVDPAYPDRVCYSISLSKGGDGHRHLPLLQRGRPSTRTLSLVFSQDVAEIKFQL